MHLLKIKIGWNASRCTNTCSVGRIQHQQVGLVLKITVFCKETPCTLADKERFQSTRCYILRRPGCRLYNYHSLNVCAEGATWTAHSPPSRHGGQRALQQPVLSTSWRESNFFELRVNNQTSWKRVASPNSGIVKWESKAHQSRCGCVIELWYCCGVNANKFHLHFKIYYKIAANTADVIWPQF